MDVPLSNVDVSNVFHKKVSFFSGFDKDPNKSKYEIYCRIPKLAIIGHYKVAGKVIILPVVGDGAANLTFGKRKNTQLCLKL